jgi:flagellar biosynthetic protein FliR
MTLGLPLSTLFGFLLVLARVSGVVVFLPVPGFRAAPEMVRAIIAVAITFALLPVWPDLPNTVPSIAQLSAWAITEAGFGLLIGVSVGLLMEGFQLAAHIIGLQAGYGYSTTVDPTSQADAGILQVFVNLIGGLFFFSLGLDGEMIRILAASFRRFPAGAWHVTAISTDRLIHLGSDMMVTGVRLAMPVVAILLVIDISLALLGRIQQQLQLLSLAFPLKMLAALGILTALMPIFPRLLSSSANRMVSGLWRGILP